MHYVITSIIVTISCKALTLLLNHIIGFFQKTLRLFRLQFYEYFCIHKLKKIDGIALHIIVERSNAIGFPFLLRVDDGVNLFAKYPSKFY